MRRAVGTVSLVVGCLLPPTSARAAVVPPRMPDGSAFAPAPVGLVGALVGRTWVVRPGAQLQVRLSLLNTSSSSYASGPVPFGVRRAAVALYRDGRWAGGNDLRTPRQPGGTRGAGDSSHLLLPPGRAVSVPVTVSAVDRAGRVLPPGRYLAVTRLLGPGNHWVAATHVVTVSG